MTDNKIKIGALGLVLVGATLCFSGCSRGQKTLAGAVIGAGAGAGIGAAIGSGTGAAIGAGSGAIVGGAVGYSLGDDEDDSHYDHNK